MNGHINILIVEDDFISAEYLSSILKNEGYNVIDVVDTGAKAIQSACEYNPDIILMDIMLKDNISGCDAAIEIHQKHIESKIIFITAYSDDEMIEYADQSEAYAYLLKPYREKEILATIKLALSHKNHMLNVSSLPHEVIKLSDSYTYNTKLNRLYKNDKEILLSKKAIKFLEILVRHKDTTVSNEQICHHIWGQNKNENTLRSLLHRMRSTIDANLIRNVNGFGYIISTP